ncbi:uncharacterized protein LOC118648596 [Monomorium pharaonis]|uniref:uncharacterized protein LOC118648596 n=1 Tax=Monomorium pharaonis TaxID=307658 RepID=UPI001746318F|nr:uncharacterized protein LOC118648596 [Monomorium pharaonis]
MNRSLQRQARRQNIRQLERYIESRARILRLLHSIDRRAPQLFHLPNHSRQIQHAIDLSTFSCFDVEIVNTAPRNIVPRRTSRRVPPQAISYPPQPPAPVASTSNPPPSPSRSSSTATDIEEALRDTVDESLARMIEAVQTFNTIPSEALPSVNQDEFEEYLRSLELRPVQPSDP